MSPKLRLSLAFLLLLGCGESSTSMGAPNAESSPAESTQDNAVEPGNATELVPAEPEEEPEATSAQAQPEQADLEESEQRPAEEEPINEEAARWNRRWEEAAWTERLTRAENLFRARRFAEAVQEYERVDRAIGSWVYGDDLGCPAGQEHPDGCGDANLPTNLRILRASYQCRWAISEIVSGEHPNVGEGEQAISPERRAALGCERREWGTFAMVRESPNAYEAALFLRRRTPQVDQEVPEAATRFAAALREGRWEPTTSRDDAIARVEAIAVTSLGQGAGCGAESPPEFADLPEGENAPVWISCFREEPDSPYSFDSGLMGGNSQHFVVRQVDGAWNLIARTPRGSDGPCANSSEILTDMDLVERDGESVVALHFTAGDGTELGGPAIGNTTLCHQPSGRCRSFVRTNSTTLYDEEQDEERMTGFTSRVDLSGFELHLRDTEGTLPEALTRLDGAPLSARFFQRGERMLTLGRPREQ